METKPIQVKHDDVLITYHEGENTWKFTLRGRDRSAESLAKAKEYIDKPVPAEKAKPFQKIPAWLFKWDHEPKKIEITGIAEGRGYTNDDAYVWINNSGTRSKESVKFNIYPSNAKNDAVVAEFIEKKKAAAKLRDEAEGLKRKLDPLVLPKDE